jgi:hypothetical protein
MPKKKKLEEEKKEEKTEKSKEKTNLEEIEKEEEGKEVESKLKELEEKTKESIFTKIDFVFIAKIFGILLIIFLFLLLTKNITFNFPSSNFSQPQTNGWWNSSFLYRIKITTNQSLNVTYILLNFSKYSNFTKWNGIRFVGKEVYSWFNATPFFDEYYLSPVYVTFKQTKGLILLKLPTSKFYNLSPFKLKLVANGSALEWWNATPFANYTIIFVKTNKPITNITISWNERVNKTSNVFEFFEDFNSLNRVYWSVPSTVTFEKRKIITPNISIANSSLFISSSLNNQFQFAGISTRIPVRPPLFTCVNFQILNSSSYDHAFEIVFSNQTKSSDGCFVGAFIGFFQKGATTQYGCDSQRKEEVFSTFSEFNPFEEYTFCLNVGKKNYSILLFDKNFSTIANKTIGFSLNNYGQIAFGSANGIWTNINQNIKVNWFFSDYNISIPSLSIVGNLKRFPSERVEIFVNNKGEKNFYVYFSNLSLETYKKFNVTKFSSNYTISEIEKFNK